jgi:hypothetical protein
MRKYCPLVNNMDQHSRPSFSKKKSSACRTTSIYRWLSISDQLSTPTSAAFNTLCVQSSSRPSSPANDKSMRLWLDNIEEATDAFDDRVRNGWKSTTDNDDAGVRYRSAMGVPPVTREVVDSEAIAVSVGFSGASAGFWATMVCRLPSPFSSYMPIPSPNPGDTMGVSSVGA